MTCNKDPLLKIVNQFVLIETDDEISATYGFLEGFNDTHLNLQNAVKLHFRTHRRSNYDPKGFDLINSGGHRDEFSTVALTKGNFPYYKLNGHRKTDAITPSFLLRRTDAKKILQLDINLFSYRNMHEDTSDLLKEIFKKYEH